MAWGGSNWLTVFALARVDPIPLPSNTVLAPKSCISDVNCCNQFHAVWGSINDFSSMFW